jgi:hypothetical protein
MAHVRGEVEGQPFEYTIDYFGDRDPTPMLSATLVAIVAWAVLAGTLAIRSYKVREAWRWRKVAIGFTVSCLVIGIASGLSYIHHESKLAEWCDKEYGTQQYSELLPGIVRRGELDILCGVAGFGLGTILVWAMSRALTREVSRLKGLSLRSGGALGDSPTSRYR